MGVENAKTPSMTYRSDIDSLRAISVIAVILFHYFPAYVSGGFIGVDVFFVISGYIITRLISIEASNGKFSVANFYERRIKRILPAYFLVMVFSLALAHKFFLPQDYKAFGESLTSSSFMGANIYFFTKSGYFDAASHTKPLLHMWSLGVEEQFYILFPMMLIAALRLGRRKAIAAIGAISLLSLCLSIWATAKAPSAAFYLLPFRAWELGLGSLLALAEDHQAAPSPAKSLMALGAGLMGVIAPAFVYSGSTAFPGFAAVAPCAGAALIIWAGRGTSCRNPLRFAPLAYVGRISFGLYLWHWPPLIFAVYVLNRDLTAAEFALLITFVTACSVASYHFVELPIRRSKPASRSILFKRAAGAVAVLACLGATITLTRGLPQRLPESVALLAEGAKDLPDAWNRCHQISVADIENGRLCVLGTSQSDAPPRFVLWGDSHAHAFMPALNARAEAYNLRGLAASHTGCPPVVGAFRRYADEKGCVDFNRAMIEAIKASKIENVVLSAFWSVYLEGWPEDWNDAKTLPNIILGDQTELGQDAPSRRRVFQRAFSQTVAELQSAGKTVWIVEQVPSVHAEVPALLARQELTNAPIIPASQVYDAHIRRTQWIKDYVSSVPGVRTIDPASALCDSGKCSLSRSGRSLYSDRNHLSVFGALNVSPLFDAIFKDAANKPRAPGTP